MSLPDHLFNRDASGRLAAVTEPHSVQLLHAPGIDEVGLVARLVDPKTGQASPESLLLSLNAGDAWMFANMVLELAKERGWKFATGGSTEVPGHPRGWN